AMTLATLPPKTELIYHKILIKGRKKSEANYLRINANLHQPYSSDHNSGQMDLFLNSCQFVNIRGHTPGYLRNVAKLAKKGWSFWR
ncbi:MAG TPA: hypothetical protein VN604_11350, partial [Nitrospirota bacterium]|nr:hypothetical protein [Nitrospirota bacterium]